MELCTYCESKPRTGKSQYCSDSCRAKASRDRNYVRRDRVIIDPSAVLGPEVVLAMAKQVRFEQRRKPTVWKLAAKWLASREA